MNKEKLTRLLKNMKEGQVIAGATKGKEYSFVGIEKYSSRGKSPAFEGKLVAVLHSDKRKRKIKLFVEILEYFVLHDGKYISYGRLPPEYCLKYPESVTSSVLQSHLAVP